MLDVLVFDQKGKVLMKRKLLGKLLRCIKWGKCFHENKLHWTPTFLPGNNGKLEKIRSFHMFPTSYFSAAGSLINYSLKYLISMLFFKFQISRVAYQNKSVRNDILEQVRGEDTLWKLPAGALYLVMA